MRPEVQWRRIERTATYAAHRDLVVAGIISIVWSIVLMAERESIFALFLILAVAVAVGLQLWMLLAKRPPRLAIGRPVLLAALCPVCGAVVGILPLLVFDASWPGISLIGAGLVSGFCISAMYARRYRLSAMRGVLTLACLLVNVLVAGLILSVATMYFRSDWPST